jgi:hypothetical protein
MHRTFCAFKPKHIQKPDEAHEDCFCLPRLQDARCHCTNMSDTWFRTSPRAANRKSTLVGYIRESEGGPSADAQYKQLAAYCKNHGCVLADTFVDKGIPAYGLSGALEALKLNDGLIAVDLKRFVEHENQLLRELRPFIHHFFCHPDKHLISLDESLDTGTSLGQKTALDLMSNMKDGWE